MAVYDSILDTLTCHITIDQNFFPGMIYDKDCLISGTADEGLILSAESSDLIPISWICLYNFANRLCQRRQVVLHY